MIRIKRSYEPVDEQDGARFLIDRLWPRGIAKKDFQLTAWMKEVAPSQALRQWFHHDTDRWEEFRKRYLVELEQKPETWQPILQAARLGNVTLLFSARDREHNNALILKEFLEERM